ncbi:hypothetical protein OROMI_009856 [Orobanche minor]
MDEAENPIPDVGPVRRERRKRGLNRNSRLEKLVRAYYDPAHPKKKFRPTITIPEHETGPIGEESIGFARELGMIVRQQAPVRIKSWMYIQQKDLEKHLESVAEQIMKTSHKNSENRAGVEYVHKMGSKSFPQMRHERINAETHELPGSIEMFAIAYSNKRGWASELAEERYN